MNTPFSPTNRHTTTTPTRLLGSGRGVGLYINYVICRLKSVVHSECPHTYSVPRRIARFAMLIGDVDTMLIARGERCRVGIVREGSIARSPVRGLARHRIREGLGRSSACGHSAIQLLRVTAQARSVVAN